MRFSAVTLPKDREHQGVIRHVELAAHTRACLDLAVERRAASRLECSHAHPDRVNGDISVLFAELGGYAPVVHGDRPGGPHHHAQHRPEVVDRSAEPFDGVFDEVGCRIGMVVPEFVAVVAEPFLIQQSPRPGMVQARVVQHDEARVARQIRPHVVVAGGVPELVHDEIVRHALLLPDEVVRVEHDGRPRLGRGERSFSTSAAASRRAGGRVQP